MSTDEIAKTIATLKSATIQEALKQAGSKAAHNSKTLKADLVSMYENAVMDVGVEKFIHRINESLISQTAKLLGTDATAVALLEKVQQIKISSLLNQASVGMLISVTPIYD